MRRDRTTRMRPLDQSFRTLSLSLWPGIPPLGRWSLLASHAVVLADVEATGYVIGASHALHVRRGKSQIVEVLACLPPESLWAYGSWPIVALPPEGLALASMGDGLGYRFHLDLLALRQKNTQEKIGSLRCRSLGREKEGYAEYLFPDPMDRYGPALTGVRFRVAREGVVVRTVHTYPREEMAVFTESEILLPPP